jgi:hypothetical protein
MNTLGFNAFSPVLLTGKEPLREGIPKRLRLSEPSEPAQIHSKHHNNGRPPPPLTQKKGRIVNMKGQASLLSATNTRLFSTNTSYRSQRMGEVCRLSPP